MQKHKNSISTAFLIMLAVYSTFMLSVVAFAFRRQYVIHHPLTFQDSALAVITDTSFLRDPKPDSMRKALEKDTNLINHSQIPPENR